MNKRNKNSIMKMFNQFRSIFLIITLGLFFGIWFAYMQISMVASDAYAAYPLIFRWVTIIKCTLTIIAFSCFSHIILSFLSRGKITFWQTALSYMPLVFVFISPITLIVTCILLWQVILLPIAMSKKDFHYLKANYGFDLLALVVFFCLHLFLTTRFSPLHWSMAMLTAKGFNSEEIPVLAPIYHGFLLAKEYSFSNIDHAQWAGIMNPPVSLASPLLQLFTFILDLPSASIETFHILINAIYFILMIAGSFGFYLFLRYALGIYGLFAFIGGYFFMFSGAPLSTQMFMSDGGIFLSPLVAFPYALLCISKAYTNQNYRFAVFAALALATQFFTLSPHPEGTIYSVLFFAVYTLFLIIFCRNATLFQRISYAFLSAMVFLMLTAFFMVPILYDQLNENMFVFAHTGDVGVSDAAYSYYQPYIQLFLIFTAITLFLHRKYKTTSPVYFSSLGLTLFLLGLVYLTLNEGFIVALINFIHMGIHFWVPSRIGVYFYTSVFIVVMYGMDILTRYVIDSIQNKFPQWVRDSTS